MPNIAHTIKRLPYKKQRNHANKGDSETSILDLVTTVVFCFSLLSHMLYPNELIKQN